jgi:signal transduction histidine kinase
MRQDQRLLMVLALAWRQLEHQIKSLAALTEADRREFINLIAPGLLHHEIGALMHTLSAQVYEQFNLLKPLALQSPENESGPIGLATRYAHAIGGLAARLHAVTDAFNNMDKRAEVEDTTLAHIFDEIRLLLNHRLGEVGAQLDIPRDAFTAISLRTDTVLLEHALLNIVNNALNAFEDHSTPPPRKIRVYVEKHERHLLTLVIANNGPAIPGSLDKDIFRRGFTARRSGHGQGLYLARLVAHYLGAPCTSSKKPLCPRVIASASE